MSSVNDFENFEDYTLYYYTDAFDCEALIQFVRELNRHCTEEGVSTKKEID